MKPHVVLFLLLIPLMASGQELSGYQYEVELQDLVNPGSHTLWQRHLSAALGTKGNPLVFEDFLNGNIYLSDKSR